MLYSLTPEQSELVELATSLARRNGAGVRVSWEEAGKFPLDFCRELARHGLTGINLPTEQGGQGMSLFESVLVLEAVATTAPHLGDAVQATNFGGIRQVAAFANDRLQHEVLAPALRGEALVNIGMSEPDAGSALGEMRTQARVEGEYVYIDGQKVFNSNGPHASHYVVWARFDDGPEGVGAVVVPGDAAGFSRGAPERFASGEAHCTLNFDHVKVPKYHLLMDRSGIRKMMAIFNIERIGNATRSVAVGELALRLAAGHMVDRVVGGLPLADRQGLQWSLADMRVRVDASRLLVHRAALELTEGVPSGVFTSIAKVAANEAAFEVVNEAITIFGGYGFSSDSPLPYLLMRARGWMTGGGTVGIQRTRIAREELKRRHA
ncbi:MAG: acyl-CoA dehydrogenase family protein [Candidatus Dormiibacterota bacterium]